MQNNEHSWNRKHCFGLLRLLLVCSMMVESVHAQLYHFERFGFEEGMPHTEVNDVIQGPDDRIYAATEKGLAVYDGSRFDVYTREHRLDSDDIHGLFSDMEGRVWIASSNGGLNYLYRDSIFQVPALKNKLNHWKVYEIFQRSDSTLIFITDKDVIGLKGDAIYSIWERHGLPEIGAIRRIATLFQDSLLYINMPDDYYIKLNMDTGRWQWINSKKPFDATIHSMRIAEKGRLFMSGDPGLVEFRNDTMYAIHGDLPKRCWDMDFDVDGNLWLFSEGGGFGKYNPKDKVYEGFNSKSGLPSNVLFGGTIDHESNVWLASYDEGLIRFRDQSLMKYNASNGIPHHAVNQMTAMRDTLYLATRQGVVRMANDQIVDTLLPGIWIWSVFATSDYVLVGSIDGPLHIYPNGEIKKQAYKYSHHLREYDDYIFSLTSNSVHSGPINNFNTLSIGWVKSLLPLENSFIFMLDDRIIKYNEGSIITLKALDASKYGSFRTMISYEGDVFIKSDKHIHRLRQAYDTIVVDNFDISSIPDVYKINAMAREGDTLWLSGPGQFVKKSLHDLLDSSTSRYTRYPISSTSIRTAILNDGITVHRGKIYGLSSKGLVIFDPKKYKFNPHETRLSLRDIKLFGNSLDKNRIASQSLRFDASENNISFVMGSSTFADRENIAYKYKLLKNGADDKWIGPITNNEIVFSNLNDGSYRFEFIADNGHGVWNKEPYKLSFKINKPVWKKPIFWILTLSVLALLILMSLLYQNRIKLKRQRSAREKLIEIQEQERKRIARELHDSVGQKIMLMAIKAKEENAKELNDLALSSLEETRAISQGLHPVVLDQLGLTDGLKDMLTKVDELTSMFIDFDIDPIDHLISKDNHIHVFRILQELVTNTIKHAQATTCSIAVSHAGESIRLVVEDNGKGFGANTPFKGLGLRSVKDRVALLDAKITLESIPGALVTIDIPIR